MRPAGIPSGNILDRFRLDGKIIVVTGAARGLGFTFATALAQAGAIIAGVDLLDEPTADFKTLTSFGGKAQYYRYSRLLHHCQEPCAMGCLQTRR